MGNQPASQSHLLGKALHHKEFKYIIHENMGYIDIMYAIIFKTVKLLHV